MTIRFIVKLCVNKLVSTAVPDGHKAFVHPRSLCSVIIRCCCLVGGCVMFARQWLVYSQAAKDTYPLRHALSY